MPWAVAVASLAVTAYSGYKQSQALKDQSAAESMVGNYNATAQQNAAQQGANFGREAVRRIITAGKRFVATQRASFGNSGIVASSGSPLIALAYDAGEARLRALEQSQQSSTQYGAGVAQSAMTRYEAGLRAKGYRKQATATLISTAGQLGSQGYQFAQTGAFG